MAGQICCFWSLNVRLSSLCKLYLLGTLKFTWFVISVSSYESRPTVTYKETNSRFSSACTGLQRKWNTAVTSHLIPDPETKYERATSGKWPWINICQTWATPSAALNRQPNQASLIAVSFSLADDFGCLESHWLQSAQSYLPHLTSPFTKICNPVWLFRLTNCPPLV